MKKILIALVLLISCTSASNHQSGNDQRHFLYGEIAVVEFKHRGHVYLFVKGRDMTSASVTHSYSCSCRYSGCVTE